MISKMCFCLLFFSLAFTTNLFAEDKSLSLFGTKPIQLSIGSDGKIEQKKGGFICDLSATLGGGHYSEWGETEKDAQLIVLKKCEGKSGLLLCKRDRITCKEDK